MGTRRFAHPENLYAIAGRRAQAFSISVRPIVPVATPGAGGDAVAHLKLGFPIRANLKLNSCVNRNCITNLAPECIDNPKSEAWPDKNDRLEAAAAPLWYRGPKGRHPSMHLRGAHCKIIV